MKKTLLQILILALGGLLILTGCAGGGGDAKETTKKTTEKATEAQPTDEPTPPAFSLEELALGGNDISRYRIVYARSPYHGIEQTYGGKIPHGELNFDQRSAERLAELIKSYFGVEIPVEEDRSTVTGSDYEILVGKTNRSQTSTIAIRNQAAKNYVLKMDGSKLVVCGGSFGATWHAIDALESRFEAAVAAEESTSVAVASGEDLSGTADLKVIACVGDSITYGSTSTEPAEFSYPATMGRLMWQDYLVYNYGASGRHVCNGTSFPYLSCEDYQKCLANPMAYDLVLIMLGTNDALNISSWGNAQKETFLTCAKTLVNSIKQRNQGAKFVFMNCPIYAYESAAQFAAVRPLQKQVVKELYADGVDISLYNMQEYTKQEMGSSLFPDGLHPADEGYIKMAQGVSALVRAVFSNSANPYLTPGAAVN